MNRTYLFLIIILGISFQLQAQNKDTINKQLFDAVKKSDFEAVKTLILKGADVNATDANKATAAIWAAYKGNLNILRYLVSKGGDASKKGIIALSNGNTFGSALTAAAGEGKTDVVKYLIEECKIGVNEPEISTDGKSGWTALQSASYNGNFAIVKYLISKKAHINIQCKNDGFTALICAILNGKTEVAKYIIENGADVDIKDENGWTALHYVCEQLSVTSYQSPVISQQYENIKNLILDRCNDKSGLNWKSTWYFFNSKGENFQKSGKYDSSLVYLEKAQIQAKKEFGEQNVNYAESLNNLALIYKAKGNYAKAEQLFLETVKISKEILGEKDPDYAACLDNLAELYRVMNNYTKAELLYLEDLKIRKEVLGEKNSYYATSLNNLALLYKDMGNYAKADPLLIKALKVKKEVFGEKSYEYAVSLDNLAELYVAMGDYSKAEPLHIEALKIIKEILGEKHPDYTTILSNLALLYKDMGNYAKAKILLIEALNIDKEVLGEKHPHYAYDLNNLAVLYKDMGNYKKADTLYLEGLEIIKEVYGEKHTLYARSLINLAGLYVSMGNYAKAELLYLEGINIEKEVLGEKHPIYAQSLYNLAGLYQAMGNNAKAEPMLIDAIKIEKEGLGEKHPKYAMSLYYLAKLYYAMGNYQKAEPLFIEANQIELEELKQSFSFMSENEQQLFLKTIAAHFMQYNSFAFRRQKENTTFPTSSNAGISELSYNNELALKGALLQAGLQMKQSLMKNGDTAVIDLYNKLRDTKEELSKLYSMPVNKRFSDVNELENKANDIEKKLIQKSSEYKNFNSFGNIKYTDVQNNLNTSDAAIEFISFTYDNGKKWTDSTLYCALVLRKDYKYPKFVYLFEEKQLKEILNITGGKTNQYSISELYNKKRTKNDEQMYNLIWEPINSLLKGVNTVYYTPSGLLNKIAFSAISISDNKYLSDKYTLNQLTSTRQLAKGRGQIKLTADYNAVIYGGIEYDLDSTQIKQNVLASNLDKTGQDENPVTRSFIPSDSTRGSTFHYLSSTLDEANRVKYLFDIHKIKAEEITGEQATEESFKNLDKSKSPSIIHIATHGFFFPDSKKQKSESQFDDKNVFKYSDNPLFRSGLAMAGANRVWSGKEPIKNVEDGILTAYEISNINLNNTKLAVLSACETGLGDIQGREGVFGLQRAFKMAGVDYIIMSLWQVPDKETAEFMETFYTNWLSGKDIRQAFNITQQQMREKYEPYKWAAFVLVE